MNKDKSLSTSLIAAPSDDHISADNPRGVPAVPDANVIHSETDLEIRGLDSMPEFTYSQDQLDKYLRMYHRALSQSSSLQSNSSKHDGTFIIDSSNSFRSSITQDDLDSPAPIAFSARDIEERAHYRLDSIKEPSVSPLSKYYDPGHFPLEKGSTVTFDSESSGSLPPPQLELTPDTTFISKTDLRDQVIAKRLKILDPKHVRLEKIHENQSNLNAVDFHGKSPHHSLQTDRSSDIPELPSLLNSNQSIPMGYWTVKPTASHQNISVQKSKQ